VATTAGHVVFESQLELARLMLADFDVDVAAIYAQPFRLTATVDSVTRSHVPDFLLVSVGGTATVVNDHLAARASGPVAGKATGWCCSGLRASRSLAGRRRGSTV